MRKQRIGLEHHRRAALGGLEIGHVLRAEDDVAFADRLMARDHAQGRGLAAAGGAEQAAIGAGRNLQVDAVNRQRRTVALGDGDQFEGGRTGHGRSPRERRCSSSPQGPCQLAICGRISKLCSSVRSLD